MTRADFYLGRGRTARWLGSVATDGKPWAVFHGMPAALFALPLPTAGEWTAWVEKYLASRRDPTYPEDGWPWPWPTSRLTDYAYTCDSGVVLGSMFGREWFAVDPRADRFGEPDWDAEPGLSAARTAEFPDMTAVRRVTYGPRSGLITGLPAF